jgi:hypothetical protein
MSQTGKLERYSNFESEYVDPRRFLVDPESLPWNLEEDLACVMNPVSTAADKSGSLELCLSLCSDTSDKIEITSGVLASTIELYRSAADKNRGRFSGYKQSLEPGNQGCGSERPVLDQEDLFDTRHNTTLKLFLVQVKWAPVWTTPIADEPITPS